MKRKVIQLAGNTLLVSIPSKWVKEYGIRKGDEIEIEEQKNRLVISTGKEQKCENAKIDVSGLDPMIKRSLGALYKSGYNEFDVSFSNIDELSTVQEVVREEFIGFEITEQGKNILKVKELSKIHPEEFETIIRRMFLIILSMAEDSLEALKQDDCEWLKQIALRDKDVNKLADFLRRIINKGSIEKIKPAPLYFIIEQLEKIGDIYRDCSGYLAKKKKVDKISKDIIEFYNDVNSFLRNFYNIYYNFSIQAMADFGKKRKELKSKSVVLLEKADKEEMMVIFYLCSSLDAVFDMNGPLMTARL